MKHVPRFPDYSVTKDGKVWSHIKNKYLKPNSKSSGHQYVILRLNNNGYKEYHKYIHHLVLEAYIGKCPDGMECRHLNSDPKDNKLKNLKWGTRSENMQDAVKHGTHRCPKIKGEKHARAKFTEHDIRMIVYMYRTGLFLQKELAKIYNTSEDYIWEIVNKKTWKHVWTA